MAFVARGCWLGGALFIAGAVVGCGQVVGANGRAGNEQSGAAGRENGMLGGGGSAASGGVPGEAGEAGAHAGNNPNLLGTGGLGACNARGWCWQNPVPAGDLFNAISEDGRFAVGENGIVFQWPDRYLPSAGSDALYYVQSAGDSLFAGGYGLWRYDGAIWTMESSAAVGALSVSPSGELWALLGQTVQHRFEGQWRSEQPAEIAARKLELLDVMVVDDDTVWALATNFVSPKAPPDSAHLSLFEFTAGVWSERGVGPQDPGKGWRFLRVGSKIYVHGRDPGRAVYSPAEDWAVAMNGEKVNGDLFSSPAAGLLLSTSDGLYSLTVEGSHKVSDKRCSALVPMNGKEALCAEALGGLVLVRPDAVETDEAIRQPDKALFDSVPTPPWAQAYAAWGTGPSDVWRAPLDHFDGVKWTSHSDQGPENFQAIGIDGSATDNVWFRGFLQLVRYDGKAFQVVPLPEDGGFVSAVHTLAADDTWIVSGEPDRVNVWHFNGVSWDNTLTVDESSFAYSQSAIVGGGDEPLWAAIGHGLYRRERDTWEKVLASDGYSLIDLAVDGSDVWVLGQDAVYQLVDGALVARGAYSSVLERIALTETHVWHFNGAHARTLPRQK